MSEYYLTRGGGIACVWQSGAKWSITHYNINGSIEWAEYYLGGIIGGYGIERAETFTMYFGKKPIYTIQKYGIRIPKPDVIIEWQFDFFKLYEKSAPHWPFEMHIDFDKNSIIAYIAGIEIYGAGYWNNDILCRRYEKLARGLCNCIIVNQNWCGCCRAADLPVPLPIAEEIAPELLF